MPITAITIANHDSLVTDRRPVSFGCRASCVVRGLKPALVLAGDSVVSLVDSFVVSVVVTVVVLLVVSVVVGMEFVGVDFVLDMSGKSVSIVVFVVVVADVVIADVSDIDTGVEVFI